MSTTPPPRRPQQPNRPPTRPPSRGVPPPPRVQAQVAKVAFGTIDTNKTRGHRIVEYGPGGVGKTTLACLAPGPVAVIDAEESLEILQDQLVAASIPLPVPVACERNWKAMRAALQSSGWDGIRTIVLDTMTKAELWAVSHTLATKKHPDKNTAVDSVEGYGYGKGFQFVYDTFLPLLGDLDAHVRAGRNVILVAHDCTTSVPNPSGEDWLRYEPRLQDPASGKASIRRQLREWCDHMLFYSHDVAVDKDGKASGSGTRTLWTTEQPFCMAKSRTCPDEIVIREAGENPWPLIIK